MEDAVTWIVAETHAGSQTIGNDKDGIDHTDAIADAQDNGAIVRHIKRPAGQHWDGYSE